MSEHKELLPTLGEDIVSEVRDGDFSRRTFVKGMGFAGLGLFSGVSLAGTLADKSPIMVDSKGVLIHEASRCVACRRCEVACTDFNDGFSSPYNARVKVGRNMAYAGPWNGRFSAGEGKYGDMHMTADTCKQCPHPVPCAEACPVGAITAHATTGARVVDTTKCIGCGICTIACPWAMPTVNPVTKKSSKCFLCNGKPECARACPTGALRYVKWRDLRLVTPTVQAGWLPATTTTDCSTCHK